MLMQNDREDESNLVSNADKPPERVAIVEDRSGSNIGLALAGILLVIAVMAAVALVWLGEQDHNERAIADLAQPSAEMAQAATGAAAAPPAGPTAPPAKPATN